MRYLILPLIVLVGCNSYPSKCTETCKSVNNEVCTEICAAEEPPVVPVAAQEEIESTPECFAKMFEKAITEKLNIQPQITVATNPPKGISTILATSEAIDIAYARKLILDTTATLLEIANSHPYFTASGAPLTANEIEIIIDSDSQTGGSLHSVSLMRGIIEYESFDKDSKSYKITKQESYEQAQAKLNSKACCGSYFVKKDTL